MILNKYSESKNGVTIGSLSDKSSSSSGSSSSTPSGSGLDRHIWGQEDTGKDIDGDMDVNGNMYIGPIAVDEDENPVPPNHQFPSEEGNLYASSSVASPEVYGNNLFIDINGKKTNLLDLLMPVGSVIMFDGKATVPANWAICNGQNGTPDLRNRFIKGVDSKEDAGKTGGSSSVTLKEENLPSHTHSSTASQGSDLSAYKGLMVPAVDRMEETSTISVASTHYCLSTGKIEGEYGLKGIPVESLGGSVNVEIGKTGSGASFDINPPFYTLIFIMRIK